ncbi:hypothetical protein PTSG_13141 [Salpingoeca rosetta]|uniref:FYVE-type domain-containing protein n=1 Tax=Salpingoeca rosetta (strain ATCC 50818 / BSB-021) TaxID=946362 RepID=F2US64_SALR5|nr:uncharacterized protein PTSG_13141 [Salpingoeca rosetta]EGD80469.1 hypothetical protein PTSG_13141 [Salpingoeca rosetta]|eukprot:XP_004988033.1 hypothetical protein PTSG_13141 [Salpingoeca rosetta]
MAMEGGRLLEELRTQVHTILEEHAQDELTDSHPSVRPLCLCLEAVLRCGLSSKSSFFGGRKDYFDFLEAALKKTKPRLLKMPARTSAGKGRLLIRHALTTREFAECIQIAAQHTRAIKDFYSEGALLREKATQADLMDLLYHLNNLTFQLADLPDGADIDADWPPSPSSSMHVPEWEVHDAATDEQQQPVAQEETDTQPLPNSNGHTVATPHKVAPAQEEDAAQLQQRIVDLERALAEAHSHNSALTEQVAQITNDHDTQLADAKTQHETKLADAKEQHETRVKELEAQLEKSAGDSEALVKELQSKLRASTEAQESVTSELEAAKQQVSELGEANTALETQLADAKEQHETQLADAKEQHETRVKELEAQLEKSAGDSEALVKELQSKLRASTEAQESVTSELEAAKQQVSELGEAKTALETRLTDAKEQLETQLADAKEQHETRVKELEAQLEKSAGDSEALVKELQSKLRASTEAQESVTSELEAAKQQVSELGEAKTALETRLTDAKEQHETQLADAKEQHETRVKELEVQLEKSAGDSEALVKELQSKLRQSTEAQESVTSKLEAANQQVSELGEAKTVLEEELQASRTTVSELEQRLSGLSGNLEESSNKHSLDLATLQSNYDACRFELSDLKMRLRSAEKEREDLQDELKHVQLASEKHAAASAREREMLTQELQMVKETNKQLDAKTRQLHEEIGATEAETARLQSDLDESKRKLEEVTKARDELQEENEGLRADLVTRTMAKAQLWSDHVTSQLKEDELRPVPQESWEDDDTVHTCPFCKSEFSFFFRKHHCRQCGKVVCDDCSQAHMHVRGYPEPQRCCKACAPRLRKQAQQQQAH